VFGHTGLIEYHQRRVKATSAIPALRNTGYSSCFHDTAKVLAAVEEMHKEVIYRRRANIDNIVISVLLTVGGMMDEDPTKRPDAWKVYDDLTRAVDQAIPPTPGPITQPPPRDDVTRPPAQNNYRPHSMPINPSSGQTGLGLDFDAASLQSRSEIHGRQAYHPPSRRSTVNGHPSPSSLSGASSIRKGKAPRRDPHSPALDTTHGSQWTPLAPIPSHVTQPDTPIGSSARPKASIEQVLEYIPKKKMYPRTILPGEKSLKRLGGRDQVIEHARLEFGYLADSSSTDLPHR